MINSFAVVAFLGATVFATPAVAHEGWIEDFDKAVTVAKEQKKDLLVDFTGSDWCGWCIKLNKEVFDHDVFREGIAANYVLVSLDFPRGEEPKSKVPNPERNQELKAKYAISGFPTILLMNSDGLVYGQTGYQEGGPEAYLKHIEELRTTGLPQLEKVTSIANAYAAAAEADKVNALRTVINALLELPADSAFKPVLAEPARDAFTLDPENKEGLKLLAVKALSLSGEHSKELLGYAIELDGHNEHGVYEAAVWAQFMSVTNPTQAKAAIGSLNGLADYKFVDKETGFMLNLNAARWTTLEGMEDIERSKAFARRALEIGHSSPQHMETAKELAGDTN